MAGHDCDSEQVQDVIPAKAGISAVEKRRRQWSAARFLE
jgi:hypothetical protein